MNNHTNIVNIYTDCNNIDKIIAESFNQYIGNAFVIVLSVFNIFPPPSP